MSEQRARRLAEILQTYRVPEDPRGTQVFDAAAVTAGQAGDLAPVELTRTEIDMLLAEPARMPDVHAVKIRATAAAVARFPPPGGVETDNQTDAFRHAYASALLTRRFGADWTATFTAAHEGRAGNRPTSMAMDLFNNEVGRGIALAHPDASASELADLVQRAVLGGDLVVVAADGAHLEWSGPR